MRVLIIGTGYVGLNTGVVLSYIGHDVTCLDTNAEKIDLLRSGQTPFYEPHLDEMLAAVGPKMRFTTSYAEADLSTVDVVFIAVGTPSLPDGNADLKYVHQAVESIAQEMDGHFLVVVNKSTVPIGSGNWVGSLIKESYEKRVGAKADGLFSVVSNPEFLRQGAALYDSFYPDRVVVGSENSHGIQRLKELFAPILEQSFTPPACLPRPAGLTRVPLLVCDLTSAEVIKYAANAFLALKISYINEIARLAQRVGADATLIAQGIGLDNRIGPRFLNPGIGWGGSCFGKDTAALVATARDYQLEMPIVQAAREVNYRQRAWVVDALQEGLKILKGRHITLLGFSFKPDTDDLRDAPSLDIARLLVQRGAIVRAHDPVALANAQRLYPDLGVKYCQDVYEALQGAEGIVLVTEWPLYRQLLWENIPPAFIVDGRNFLDREKLKELGFKVIGVGR
ncbi:MAG TPA: UDP-glucose/GDP-mannose dehydrogenase family protein [Anaerolineaceae bacterium]|jgi:UDPglucose 6-dehydrogenase|nr:UDP-glucose/GDP-mannose dehydrogenase family protein [Anaerolineaceae bacterium]HOT25130.1 UDP-glucose/GDP-mannose dehydrogenase family protein [Anaerolineaceae bacterium]HQH57938.1 UDP-glucose/GDP-mannose dehydrogenase family protein [Anaerolineaceae bacterium]HQK02809.1 UDP-glucose/GDP-mannose dehydrogenase family protein [Anaerolineaceae bacterium]HQL26914.1 UDP-glucose/GDP-mannose dehydrogenase family protein [Anaerolineaceae bacterium]